MSYEGVIDASPYDIGWEDIRRDFMIRGYISFGLTDYRSVIMPMMTNDVYRTHAQRAEELLRIFHRRPSWRTFIRLIRAAFLSGFEDSHGSQGRYSHGRSAGSSG
jgi:hypothetical protein